jgi:hypothetical protein
MTVSELIAILQTVSQPQDMTVEIYDNETTEIYSVDDVDIFTKEDFGSDMKPSAVIQINY